MPCRYQSSTMAADALIAVAQRSHHQRHRAPARGVQAPHQNANGAALDEAGDEVHVARQTVELGDQHGAAPPPRRGERGRELGAAVEGVGALARLHLDEGLDHRHAVLGGEEGAARGLRLEPEAGAPLARGGDAVVGDHGLHGGRVGPFRARDNRPYHRLAPCHGAADQLSGGSKAAGEGARAQAGVSGGGTRIPVGWRVRWPAGPRACQPSQRQAPQLVMAAAKTWRRLKGENQLPKVVQGVTFRDGVEVIKTSVQTAA